MKTTPLSCAWAACDRLRLTAQRLGTPQHVDTTSGRFTINPNYLLLGRFSIDGRRVRARTWVRRLALAYGMVEAPIIEVPLCCMTCGHVLQVAGAIS